MTLYVLLVMDMVFLEPLSNAITPYKKLAFSCFVIKKGTSFTNTADVNFSFPLDLFL